MRRYFSRLSSTTIASIGLSPAVHVGVPRVGRIRWQPIRFSRFPDMLLTVAILVDTFHRPASERDEYARMLMPVHLLGAR